MRGGYDADVPVPFLCCRDQPADVGGDPGRADHDLEERLVVRVTHAGTPSWRLKRRMCGSGSASADASLAVGVVVQQIAQGGTAEDHR